MVRKEGKTMSKNLKRALLSSVSTIAISGSLMAQRIKEEQEKNRNV